jgi:porin
MSHWARDLDLDTIAFSGEHQPLRDYELTIELTYQAQIRPGWTVQPVFQYVVHPGGHVPDPLIPWLAVRDGALIGVRTAITY